MKLSQLIAIDKDVEITGIAVDSRKVEKGNLFICLSGSHYDGHDFAKDAIENGAAAVICDRSLGLPCEIQVSNTRKTAAQIYSAWYGYPQKKLKIVGVTGTNGKTSVVNLLNAIYQKAGYRTAISGTLGSFWGDKQRNAENTTALPEVLYRTLHEMVEDGVEYLFMEVSSHALALDRVSEINFAYGVYTNLTPEHLDFHKTMENYAAAKAKLFEQSQVGVFNYDDKYSYIAAQECSCLRYGFGKKQDSDFLIDNILLQDISGLVFTVQHNKETYLISSQLAGEFNLYNILAALSVAVTDGIDIASITEALAEFKGVKGRLERIYNGDFAVFIDYAHTPDALARVLATLRKEAPQRLRVLFGCGGDRDKSKRPVMGEIAMTLADDVIVTSDNARTEEPSSIIEDILRGMRDSKTATTFKVIVDRRLALEYAIDTALLGDVLLVAGKGHEDYEIDCSGRHPFSEKSILLERLRERRYLQ